MESPKGIHRPEPDNRISQAFCFSTGSGPACSLQGANLQRTGPEMFMPPRRDNIYAELSTQ
jgi:hypothetical protein